VALVSTVVQSDDYHDMMLCYFVEAEFLIHENVCLFVSEKYTVLC
jgi:hypothetical protein